MSNSNRHVISMDDFASELMKDLEEYTEDVTQAITKTVNKTARETVRILKSSAPKKSGAYAKDFAQKKGSKDSEKIIYNKKHYQLTHLLENGHDNAKPIKHIGSARDEAVEKVEKQIKEIIKKGG